MTWFRAAQLSRTPLRVPPGSASASLTDEGSSYDIGRRALQAVLRAADTRLGQLRASGVPDAGGLVIAGDQKTARDYAELLEAISGTTPP